VGLLWRRVGTTSSETYHGPSAFSAPETRVVRDFVNSRVVGGVTSIRSPAIALPNAQNLTLTFSSYLANGPNL
jgi:hypothetical protein